MALLVFLTGLAATIYYWHNLRQSVQSDIEAAYTRQVSTLAAVTASRVQLYETVLRGSGGLFEIHEGLTQADWDKFYQPYEIRQKFPDIEGVGVSRYLTKADVPAYLERRAAQGDANFKIFPEGDRQAYVPVTFSAQYSNNGGMERGYDGYTNPIHRTAMDRAVETGGPTMSGMIYEAQGKRTLFVLYLPVYEKRKPTATAEQRKQALMGFTYVVVNMKILLDEVIKANQSPHIALQIRDGTSKQLAYQSGNFRDIADQKGTLIHKSTVPLYGYPWHITFATSPDILSPRGRQLPDQALLRGLVTCVFFAGLVWYLITDRERKYARQKQQEVQTAKDDLLSLASHQLRTPATVVKQYVGMLLQGYGGKVTKHQLDMLTKAYESNERQLEIINQLLYVARLDAGRITLHKEKTDIAQLLRTVARDQDQSLKERKHKLVYQVPKRPIYAQVDLHYMRMVIENLLSNAIKYTPAGGTVTLGIHHKGDEVVVAVHDTGVGVSSEALAVIFEKFSRVENELSTDVNGSGVGLYLTQEIVNLHGGTIDVVSVPGEGSVFMVRLPKRDA